MNKEQLAALRKLAEEATPVAYQSTRNGFIAKENKNPEYNTPLYKFDPPIILKLLDYIETLEKDAARLNLLDRNLRFKMGWYVGFAPFGNVSIKSVIQPAGATGIREAIDAAMQGETK